jgi:hypothetical protein
MLCAAGHTGQTRGYGFPNMNPDSGIPDSNERRSTLGVQSLRPAGPSRILRHPQVALPAVAVLIALAALGLYLGLVRGGSSSQSSGLTAGPATSEIQAAIEGDRASQNPLHLDGTQSLRVDSLKTEDDWGVVPAHIITEKQISGIGGGGVIVIAIRKNGSWKLVYPGDSEYKTLVNNVPESLLPSNIKSLLQ